jgi:hypothetical protein
MLGGNYKDLLEIIVFALHSIVSFLWQIIRQNSAPLFPAATKTQKGQSIFLPFRVMD